MAEVVFDNVDKVFDNSVKAVDRIELTREPARATAEATALARLESSR